MRRFVSKQLVIILLVVATALPASAAARTDDGPQPGFFERIVRIIKHIVAPLDDLSSVPSFPKP